MRTEEAEINEILMDAWIFLNYQHPKDGVLIR